MINPDKWIRKYFSESLDNLTIDGNLFKVYDTINHEGGNTYILLSTQSKEESYEVKCSMRWNCEITLDIVTIYNGTGSRLLADNTAEQVVNICEPIIIENFETIDFSREYPADLSVNTGEQSIFRKLIKYNIKLKQNGS